MLKRCVGSLLVLSLAAVIACAATVEGTIKKVECTKEKCSIVVTAKDKDTTFNLAKDCKVTVDGKEAKVTDLKEGQTAKVTYEKTQASVVDATSAKKKK